MELFWHTGQRSDAATSRTVASNAGSEWDGGGVEWTLCGARGRA